MPGQRDLHAGRLAYDLVEQGPGRQVLVLSENGLRTMAVFKISVHGADAEHRVDAAPAQKEISAGADHQPPVERAMGEGAQAVAGTIFRYHPGVG